MSHPKLSLAWPMSKFTQSFMTIPVCALNCNKQPPMTVLNSLFQFKTRGSAWSGSTTTTPPRSWGRGACPAQTLWAAWTSGWTVQRGTPSARPTGSRSTPYSTAVPRGRRTGERFPRRGTLMSMLAHWSQSVLLLLHHLKHNLQHQLFLKIFLRLHILRLRIHNVKKFMKNLKNSRRISKSFSGRVAQRGTDPAWSTLNTPQKGRFYKEDDKIGEVKEETRTSIRPRVASCPPCSPRRCRRRCRRSG